MKLISTLLAAAAALLCVACGPSKPVLNVYTWSDYIDPAVVEAFEKAYNCKVKLDFFDSNESMYAKIKAGATGYDLLNPSTYMSQKMFRENMIAKLDHSKLPNLKNVDKAFLKNSAVDKDMVYSVPYMLCYAVVAYNKDKVPELPDTWAIFGNAAFKSRATMLNDMRETIGAALKYLGYSLNSKNPEEIEKAKNLVLEWKKNLATFDNEVYKNGLNSGEFVVVHGNSGDLAHVFEENDKLAAMLPKEGISISCDEWVLPVTTKQAELAHAFINFMCDPENAAKNIEVTCYAAPIEGAKELISEELRNNPLTYPPAEVLKHSETIEDLSEAENALYSKAWDEIRFSN